MPKAIDLFCFSMVLLVLYRIGNAYTSHCPFHSQWNLRASHICNISDRYLCLYDANIMQNVEACSDRPYFDTPGFKIQIHGSLEGVPCSSDRYQPFKFWTHGSNICKFGKSFCSGEGQLPFSIGTNTADRTCRCDYTKGYDFVVRPKRTCFCIPSEEDCSCFIRQCPSGCVLSPDYNCSPVKQFLTNSVCPLITRRVYIPIPTKEAEGDDPGYQLYVVQIHRRHIIEIVVVCHVLLVIGLVVCFHFGGCTCERKIQEHRVQKQSAIGKQKNNSQHGKWKDSLIKFVPTRASTEIFMAIRDNPCVLITGPFGSGKTAIAYQAILNLEKEGYKIIFASDPEEIFSRTNGNQRLLFLFDDVFGKYSSNVFGITAKWENNASAVNAVLARNGMVKIIITCRTYIYQLNEKVFEHLCESISFIHKNLISKKLKLSLEERRHIFYSYLEPGFPKSQISDEVLLLYHFFPIICSSYNNDNYLEYFKHPDKIISVEISEMQKHSDIGYLALAILVIFNNRVETKILSGKNHLSIVDPMVRDICIESNFNQYPLQHLLHMTFMSLVGEFVKNEKTFLSFLCPELFDVVTTCIGGSFIQSILTHSSSLFIKEKLQLSKQGNTCSHAVKVPQDMEEKFYRRLISDMNNKFIFNVLSNKHFTSQENRSTFSVYLQNNAISSSLVDAATGSNVLHFVSSLGYSDMLTIFLTYSKCPSVNDKNIRGKTPLHLACMKGNKRCVECLIKFKSKIDEKDSINRTALHYACESGVEDIVKYLISNNASTKSKDLKGMMPLHIACEKGNLNVVQCLAEKKIINEADKKGRTPLHYACTHSMHNIVDILISNKANVNYLDEQGSTPLHIACEYGNEKVISILVKNNAKKYKKNKQGQRPADIAKENGFETLSLSLFSVKDH